MADATAAPKFVDSPRPDPLYRWFTPVPQNWLALVVRGGDLVRVIHGVKDWYVDENFHFQPNKDGKEEIFSITRTALGLEFVGVPKLQGLHRYKFSWNKYWRTADGVELAPQAHEAEYIVFTPFDSQYPLVFSGIEVSAKDKNSDDEEALIPIGITVTIRIRMRRPEVALMTNTDWLGGVVTPSILRAIKNFVGEETYDSMVRGSKGGVEKKFRAYIKGQDVGTEILRDGGVEVIEISITDIKPNPEFEKALVDLAVAQRDAQKTITTAEAQKKATILKAEGEKRAAELQGEGEAAAIIAKAQADAERIRLTTLLVAGRAGGDASMIEKWRSISSSNITTMLEAGAQGGILIGPDGKPLKN